MAQRSRVPKFGNWEGEDDVPYTAYFDKARKGRTGIKIINPNDPEENSDLFPDNSLSDSLAPSSKPIVDKGSVQSTNELHKSLEDGDPKHFIDSPARHDNAGNRSASDSPARHDNAGNKSASDSAPRHGGHGVGSNESRRRPSRQSTGSEYSIERSPLHRQARTPGRDSPSMEGKNSYDGSHGTPGRSRLRPVNRGDETPDKGAAVPKFGEWDVTNPASADGYTHIFNKVREERQGGAGHVPGTPNERPHVIRSQTSNETAQCCCFGWGKK